MTKKKKQKYIVKNGAETRRNYSVNTRFNQSEIDELDFLRGTYSRGRYLRLLFAQKDAKVIPEINQQVYKRLVRTTSNLNQVAHHLNKNGFDASEIDEIRAALDDIKAQAIGLTLVDLSAALDEQDEQDLDLDPELED